MSHSITKPLCIDLFCGLGGWSEGFLAEGYECLGFDIERHDYGSGGYPGQLVLQDILTLHGSQFRNASVIVASPPCQEYSYMAMPWSLAKAKAADYRAHPERIESELNVLFRACFRIQREASETAGHHIPMVVENVRGAQPWVGRAAWSFGSFYLWGDVPALMPKAKELKFNPDGTNHGQGSWFAVADSKNRGARKNNGGSWFAVAHNTTSGHSQNPDGRKVPGMNFHDFEKTGKPGRSFQSESVKRINSYAIEGSDGGPVPSRSSDRVFGSVYDDEGEKASPTVLRGVGDTFGWSKDTPLRNNNSKSLIRKAASAMIAKIPFALSQWIAKVYDPRRS